MIAIKNFLSAVFLLTIPLIFSETIKAQNIITAENEKEGSTDWILTKVHADTCQLTKPYKADLFCSRDLYVKTL